MILGTRPTKDDWLDASFTVVDIAPLSTDESEALLRLSAPDLAPHIRSEIARTAEGNPLALVQLPHAMIVPGTNALVRDAATFTGAEDWSRLFESRLDRLDEASQRVILITPRIGSERSAANPFGGRQPRAWRGREGRGGRAASARRKFDSFHPSAPSNGRVLESEPSRL